MFTVIKNLRDLNQRNEQAMLLIHLLLSIVSETCHSRIPELQGDNVVEDCHTSTINKSQPAEPHFATAMEASLVGNHDKQPHWYKAGSQESVSCNGCLETQTGHFKTFSINTRRL
jgi:ABC-type dipeptide/oligopeptide/nickel transport system ATPase component